MDKILLSITVFAIFLILEVWSRPPTPEEIKEQPLNADSKDDYDTLPAFSMIPENIKESFKKQKILYLQLLQQHHL
ncbi:unnamed protein product [Dracunculus medinensis]|uniref:Uncharacterized protein n=1 Tax=Dracunculus medinensis TaxID=318479 RepID=A0A0N4UQ56_DRAME|nr:unnamed protein product [Dracunculus medinensis]